MDKVKNPVKGKSIDISFKINRPVKYLSTGFLHGYDESEENKKFTVKAKLGWVVVSNPILLFIFLLINHALIRS